MPTLFREPKRAKLGVASLPLDILAVIPARGGSRGLPRKNILPLGGVPLIVHTVRAAQRSRKLIDFIVSTDNASIAAAARKAGANVPFLRPAHSWLRRWVDPKHSFPARSQIPASLEFFGLFLHRAHSSLRAHS